MIDLSSEIGREKLLEKVVNCRDRDGMSFDRIAQRIDSSKSTAFRIYQEAKGNGHNENR